MGKKRRRKPQQNNYREQGGVDSSGKDRAGSQTPAPSTLIWKAVPAKNPFRINPSAVRDHEDTEMEEPPEGSKSHDEFCTLTQYHDGAPTQELEMVVGFDFGTSCTKVVIQDTARRNAYAVPFEGHSCPHNPYLLPAQFFIRKDGRLSLSEGISSFDNLKVSLLTNRDQVRFVAADSGIQVRARHLIAGYIALALQEARSWFWRTHGEVYKGYRIIWQMNIGLPSRTYDESPMQRAFRSAALAGWNLSVQTADITLLKVWEAMNPVERQLAGNPDRWRIDKENGCLHPDMVQAVPEVIAEVIGYARSPMRKNGMYLLLDVGASTLDISTFRLHEKEGEDLYPILAADVQQLGSLRLHHNRIRYVAKAVEEFLYGVAGQAGANTPVPHPSVYAPRIDDVGTADAEFKEKCARTIGQVVARTRQHRDPHANEWQIGLPVFVCGGGASLGLYREAVTAAAHRLSAMNVRDIVPIDLPQPENLVALDLLRDQYHRLAVAYGLSFSHLDIGRIIAPSELEDIRSDRKVRDTESAFVSKDMV